MKVTGQRQERGISNAIFHLWWTKCGGMKPCLHKELKDIQEDNSRLKCMNTNRSMMYDTTDSTHKRNRIDRQDD
jgi:hypothetical protein